MTAVNYAKAKAKARGRDGEPLPRRVNVGTWRTTYPEVFPVVVTRMDSNQEANPNQSGNRIKDGNHE